MAWFWQFMSNVGFYIAVIFLVLTIVFAQSSRPQFQKLQFFSLIMAVFVGIIAMYAVSRTADDSGPREKNASKSSVVGQTKSKDSAAATSRGGQGSKAGNVVANNADVQPSFVDASLLHFLVVPVFGSDRPVAILGMNFPRQVLVRKGITECFLVGQAEPSVSSDRIILTTKKLVCRKGNGSLVSVPFKGYVLDAEDGKLGLKARREELAAVPPVSPVMADIAKEAGLVLEQSLKKGSGMEASFQVVRTGRLASVIVMEAITLPE